MKPHHLPGCILIASMCALVANSADAQLADSALWVASGGVNASARDGNIIYVGGSFSMVGPATGGGAFVDANGAVRRPFPAVFGSVYTAIPDGSGGCYIGGDFTAVGGIPRTSLAHILSDGTVSDWYPRLTISPDGYSTPQYSALAIQGNTIYTGGNFRSVGDTARNNLAAFDISTGELKAWNPDADAGIRSLAVSGGVVYVAGDFSTVGGQTRNSLAALDATTGLATSWNAHIPPANGSGIGYAYTVAVGGSLVYVGGVFEIIGGQPRHSIAALRASDATATAWNPNAGAAPDGVVTLVVSGSTVYAAGNFTTMGGIARPGLAAIDASTGAVSSWNPVPNQRVGGITVSGSTVFLAGGFTSVGGQTRNRLAAVDAVTGVPTPWNPSASSSAYVVVADGGTIYVGGVFVSLGAIPRNRLAAFDATTGMATSWAPGADGRVDVLAVAGGAVYVGGPFANVGGQPRARLAAIDATSGAVTSWNPGLDGNPAALAISGNTVYVGGGFLNAGGLARKGIAAIDRSTGVVTSWDAHAGGSSTRVNALGVLNHTIFVGGQFESIGGQPRSAIAAIDSATGFALSWGPKLTCTVCSPLDVRTLRTHKGRVYISGNFNYVGPSFNQLRRGAAAFDPASNVATAWDPALGYTDILSIGAMAGAGNSIFLGGGFTSLGGLDRNYIGAVDDATGQVTPWKPFGSGGAALMTSGNTLYASGEFLDANGVPHRFAALPTGVTTGGGGPDIALDKFHLASFVVGQSGTYQFVVTNLGSTPTTGAISVLDTLPAGLAFVSAAGAGWTFSNIGQLVTASFAGALAGGESAEFSLTVSVGAAAFPSVTNFAATATAGDANPSNDGDSDPTPVAGAGGAPDLSLSKQHSSAFAVGQTGAYTLTVRNVGTAPTAGAITVTDTLPSGLTFASVVAPGYVVTNFGSLVSAQYAASLAPGADAPFTLTVNVLPSAAPAVTNRATVSGSGDTNPANDVAVDVTVIGSAPDLTIDKRHTGTFAVGQSGTYTIVVTNAGGASTSGTITVRDTLPAGLAFVSAAGAGWTISDTGQVVTAVRAAAIAPGDSAQFTITVNLSATAFPAVINAATVSGGGDTNLANNRDADPTLLIGSSDLAIDKRHILNFQVGQNGAYRLVVTNFGTASAMGPTTVRDTLPAGLTYVSATGTGWSVSNAAGLVTATYPGAIPAGDSVAFNIVVSVGAGAVPSVTNSATVYGTGDSNPSNDRDADPAAVDATTPALVELFRAVNADGGVRIEWKVGDGGSPVTVSPQRSDFSAGPWARVAGSVEDREGVQSLLDREAPSQASVWYRLAGATLDGRPFISTAIMVEARRPSGTLFLDPIAPNPSQGLSLLRFSVASRSHVRISIVDVQGREVSRLADALMDRGDYTNRLDTRDLRAGLYFVRLQSEGVELRRAFVLIR